MAQSFVFKQFTLQQEKAAFKLGTDSVLLGSWVSPGNYKRILDLGAGTGILGLMMAQRFSDAHILAIEIDTPSVEDCANNFAQSGWNNRLKILNQDLAEWSEASTDEKFDLIITNPPYFSNSLKSPDDRKSIARHLHKMSTDKLVKIIQLHLDAQGSFACILPVKEFAHLSNTLLANRIYLNRVCHISSFEHSEVIREMGMFSSNQVSCIEENQFIYTPDHSRSDWYKSISADFYIK